MKENCARQGWGPNFDLSVGKGKTVGVGTWRIIPVSKWLITMVIVSPLNGVVPFTNGLKLLTNWDDPPSSWPPKTPSISG